MTLYSANPFAYVFSVVAICAVVGYFIYAIVDRIGLEVRAAVATVTGKQFTPSGKSYYTTIVQGRSWVQSQETPETYAVMLSVNGERTVGLASKQQYEDLQVDDSVQVKLRRTRITKRLEVIEIAR